MAERLRGRRQRNAANVLAVAAVQLSGAGLGSLSLYIVLLLLCQGVGSDSKKRYILILAADECVRNILPFPLPSLYLMPPSTKFKPTSCFVRISLVLSVFISFL